MAVKVRHEGPATIVHRTCRNWQDATTWAHAFEGRRPRSYGTLRRMFIRRPGPKRGKGSRGARVYATLVFERNHEEGPYREPV